MNKACDISAFNSRPHNLHEAVYSCFSFSFMHYANTKLIYSTYCLHLFRIVDNHFGFKRLCYFYPIRLVFSLYHISTEMDSYIQYVFSFVFLINGIKHQMGGIIKKGNY